MAESLGKAVLDLAADTKGLDRDMDRAKRNVDRDSKEMGNSLGENMTKAFLGLRAAMGLIKMPALIAAVGPAIQALGALSAGAVALSASLGPLAGAGAGVAGMYVTLGQAFGVVKLGFGEIGKALAGNEEALKRLTPAQKEFLGVLKKFKPEMDGLKESATAMFPGMTAGLKAVRPIFDTLKPIIDSTAQAIGGLAEQAGKLVGSQGFMSRISRIGMNNVGVLKNIGTGALGLVDAFVHLLDAARPLTSWFGKLAAQAGTFISKAAAAGNESGRLAAFFEKTKAVMTTWGHIIRDLAVGLFNVFKGGAALGNDMTAGLEGAMKKFREWTESTKGKSSIAQYFADAKPVLAAVGGLIWDITKAITKMSTSKGITEMIKSTRPLIPMLENLFTATSSAFGPLFVETLSQVIRLFIDLAGTNGPLNMFVRTIGLVARGAAILIENVPGLQSLIFVLMGFYGVNKVLKMTGIMTAAKFLLALAGAGNAVAVSQARMTVSLIATKAVLYAVRAATIIATAAQWLWNAAMMANPIGVVIIAIIALVAAIIIVVKNFGFVKKVIVDVWNAIKEATKVAVDFMVRAVTAAWNAIRDATRAVWNALKSFLSSIWNAIKTVFMNATVVGLIINHWDKIRDVTRNIWNAIVDFIRGIPGRIGAALSALAGVVSREARQAFNAFMDIVRTRGGDVLEFVRSIPGRIASALGNLGSLLYNAGRSLLQGFLNGITSKVGEIIGKVKDAVQKVKDLLPGSEPKDPSSPLRGLKASGAAIIDNLIAGIGDGRLQAALNTQIGDVRLPAAATPTNSGPLVNIERMDVNDRFDEQRLAADLSWRVSQK